MKCTNEACPYRQEPGPVECPAANNGCGGYDMHKTNFDILRESLEAMANALCAADYCRYCEHERENGLCGYIEDHPGGRLYDGCIEAAAAYLAAKWEGIR